MNSNDNSRHSTDKNRSADPHGGPRPTRGEPIDLGDLRRVTPVTRGFGYARGRPVDRYFIERFLEENASLIRGDVLEVGDNAYTLAFGGTKVTRSDVLHVSPGAPGATIVADLSSAPHLAANHFDCIICTQTLQLIYDVRSAVRTLHRILKPGGSVLATMPGISQTDDPYWGATWYWNFTPVSAHRVFGECFEVERLQVRAHGNVLTAVAFLYGLATEDLTPEELNHVDGGYPFLITVRATKPPAAVSPARSSSSSMP